MVSGGSEISREHYRRFAPCFCEAVVGDTSWNSEPKRSCWVQSRPCKVDFISMRTDLSNVLVVSVLKLEGLNTQLGADQLFQGCQCMYRLLGNLVRSHTRLVRVSPRSCRAATLRAQSVLGFGRTNPKPTNVFGSKKTPPGENNRSYSVVCIPSWSAQTHDTRPADLVCIIVS